MNNAITTMYSTPDTIDAALALVSRGGDFAFVAGGTDLLIQRYQGNNNATHLIDLRRIEELKRIRADEDSVSIGAGVTLAAMIGNQDLRSRFPTVIEAARSVASPLIRSAATIAGNLLCQNRCVYFDQSEFWRDAVGYCLKCGGDVCIATGGTKACYSVFISDIAPVLIVLHARIEYITGSMRETITVESLYTGDGRNPHTLPRDAIVTRIVIPEGNEGNIYFCKIRPSESVDFTNLTLAMRCRGETLSLAASGVGPGPAVAHIPRDTDTDALATRLLARTQIIDNLAYGRRYRREMLARLVAVGREKVADERRE